MRSFVVLAALAACHDIDKPSSKEHEHEAAHVDEAASPVAEDSPAKKALHAYLNASTCADRQKTIVFPEHNPLTACTPIAATSLDTSRCDAIDAGAAHCRADATLGQETQYFFLVQDANGLFRVDVRASEVEQRGMKGAQVSDFVQRKPLQPSVMRASVHVDRMASHFAAGFTPATHYLLRFYDGLVGLDGYFAKSSPDAAIVASFLARERGGAVVALKFPTKDSRDAIVTRIFSPDFYETPAEDEFLAKDGGS